MTENNFEIMTRDDGVYILQTEEYRFHLDEKTHIEKIGKLINENEELKEQLKEFEVFESNRIKGAVVTNDDFSVTLHNNNEAYMVCNMLNRFIRSVKNGSTD